MNQNEFAALSEQAAVEYMAAQAQKEFEAGTYENVCIMGEPVFYVSAKSALVPGHIYSETGIDEFKISRACEYHFDKWFAEVDDAEAP